MTAASTVTRPPRVTEQHTTDFKHPWPRHWVLAIIKEHIMKNGTYNGWSNKDTYNCSFWLTSDYLTLTPAIACPNYLSLKAYWASLNVAEVDISTVNFEEIFNALTIQEGAG